MRFDRGKLLVGSAEIGWRIGFGNGKGEIKYLSESDMPEFTPAPDGGVWHNEEGLSVTVRWQEKEGLLQGHISYSGNHNGVSVEEMIFPRAVMEFDEKTRILAPHSQGRILKNLKGVRQETGDEWHEKAGRYCSFRFTAALFGSKGFYFDCRDSGWWNKGYRWSSEGGKLVFSHIHYCPLDGRTQDALPYTCGVTEFDGDWFEAAQIYRKWARRQRWYVNAAKDNNPLKNIAMWLWNRGRINYVLPPAERLARESAVPVALDWYWWHHNPYDTDYPDFWPPREGEEAFRKAVERMNAQGIYTQVYVNGRTWDQDGPTYREGGDREIEIRRDGTGYAVAFNTYNHHRLGYMCGEAPVFQRKIADLVKKLTGAGLPGVYLDMIGCTAGTNCYNPAHKHAPGGGTYSIGGFRDMMELIRRENPGKLFSTEDCAEDWLDLFESMIVLSSTSNERMGDGSEYVPAFSAVYHGANALFGSYALPDAIPPWDELWPPEDRFPAADEKDWNALYPCQFFLELAREVVWGMQPMVCNLQMKHLEDPEFAEVRQFILDTARFYYDNREILYSADMAAPGVLECGTRAVEFMVRGIFTHMEHLRTIRKAGLPAVIHSVWHRPEGGRVLILANYTPQAQKWRFETASGVMEPRSYRRVDLP